MCSKWWGVLQKLRFCTSSINCSSNRNRTTKLIFCNTPHYFEHIDDARNITLSRYLGAADVNFCNTPHHFGYIDAVCILSSSTILKTWMCPKWWGVLQKSRCAKPRLCFVIGCERSSMCSKWWGVLQKLRFCTSSINCSSNSIRTTKLIFCNTLHHFEHIDDVRNITLSRYLGAANVNFCNTPHHFGYIDAACILSSSTILKTWMCPKWWGVLQK